MAQYEWEEALGDWRGGGAATTAGVRRRAASGRDGGPGRPHMEASTRRRQRVEAKKVSQMAVALVPQPPVPTAEIVQATTLKSLHSVALEKAQALAPACAGSHLNALLQIGDVVPGLAPLVGKLHGFFKPRMAAPPPPTSSSHALLATEAADRVDGAGRTFHALSLQLAHDLRWKQALRRRVEEDVSATRGEIRELVASIAGDSKDLKDAKDEITMLQRCIHVMYRELLVARERMRQTEEPADIQDLKTNNLSLAEEVYVLKARCADYEATAAAMKAAQEAKDEVAAQKALKVNRHVASLQAKLRQLQQELRAQQAEVQAASAHIQMKEREILTLRRTANGGTCGACTFTNLKAYLDGAPITVPHPTDPKLPPVALPAEALNKAFQSYLEACQSPASVPLGASLTPGQMKPMTPPPAALRSPREKPEKEKKQRDDPMAPYKARIKELDKVVAKYEKAMGWVRKNVVMEADVPDVVDTRTMCHLDPTSYDAFLATDRAVVELYPWDEAETLVELTQLFATLPAVNASLSFRSKVDWDPDVKFDTMVMQYIIRYKSTFEADRLGWTLLRKSEAQPHAPLCRLFMMCMRGYPAVLAGKLGLLLENVARMFGEQDQNSLGRLPKKAALKVLDRYCRSARAKILVREVMSLSGKYCTENQLLYLDACMTEEGARCPFSRFLQHQLLDAYELLYEALVECPSRCAVESRVTSDVLVLSRSAATAYIEQQLLLLLANSGIAKLRTSSRSRLLLSVLDVQAFVKAVFSRLDSLNASSHISCSVEDQLDDWVRAEQFTPAAINTPLITSDPTVVVPMLLLDTPPPGAAVPDAPDAGAVTTPHTAPAGDPQEDAQPAAPLPMLGQVQHHVARGPLQAEGD
eukprot:TRINITY_DN656_c0_g2_i1.p1 TRINITY_DN656_c0_g2~~TRINITY_DN656_c0_g2_i1.p1  ORF type:complete len:870 (+),score=349.28 TRINITY_DN656_c0_g2_i1:110-2719(+)